MIKRMGYAEALEIRFDSGAGKNKSIREYLMLLLTELWRREEGFSGKRPFGNGGWKWDLYYPLVKGGFLPGAIDEDGDLQEFDQKNADRYVMELIDFALQK